MENFGQILISGVKKLMFAICPLFNIALWMVPLLAIFLLKKWGDCADKIIIGKDFGSGQLFRQINPSF